MQILTAVQHYRLADSTDRRFCLDASSDEVVWFGGAMLLRAAVIARAAVLSVTLGVWLINPVAVSAQTTRAPAIKQIIDETGDGNNPLNGPFALAVDGASNVYVVGTTSNNVFMIPPAGEPIQIIDCTGDGTGNCTSGEGHPLILPYAVAADDMGNVYVVGRTSSNAFKITTDGAITQIIDGAGDGTRPLLMSPEGVAVDASGNAYVTGSESNNAFRITPAGTITQIIDVNGDGTHPLLSPGKIAVDGTGGAYVSGTTVFFTPDGPLFSSAVFKVPPQGPITLLIDIGADGTNRFSGQSGLAVDRGGTVYAAGITSHNAFRIPADGRIAEIIDIDGDGSNALVGPTDVAVDRDGNVYVTGESSSNAFKIQPGAVPVEIIDRKGDRTNALEEGQAVAVDAAGNAYVAGFASDNVFRILRCGDGFVDPEEQCDRGACCNPDCTYARSETVCRASIGACDPAETCTGTAAECPGDAIATAETVCREAVNRCDRPETCSGDSVSCPADGRASLGAPCEDDGNLCSVDLCDGFGTCRHDTPAGLGQPCGRAPGTCNDQDRCGRGLECLRNDLPNGTPCRTFCENSQCTAGECTPREGVHPCGPDPANCNDASIGSECVSCGDGNVQPGEECDDGNTVAGDGCTPRCALTCDPADAEPRCPTTDACVVRRDCAPTFNPTVANPGMECRDLQRISGCRSCNEDSDCDDPCSRCRDGKCEEGALGGFARATCGFEVELLDGLISGEGSACAETGPLNKKADLRTVTDLHRRAEMLLRDKLRSRCVSEAEDRVRALRKRARALLRKAIIRANAARSPFRRTITDNCAEELTRRLSKLFDNLEKAKGSSLEQLCAGA